MPPTESAPGRVSAVGVATGSTAGVKAPTGDVVKPITLSGKVPDTSDSAAVAAEKLPGSSSNIEGKLDAVEGEVAAPTQAGRRGIAGGFARRVSKRLSFGRKQT